MCSRNQSSRLCMENRMVLGFAEITVGWLPLWLGVSFSDLQSAWPTRGEILPTKICIRRAEPHPLPSWAPCFLLPSILVLLFLFLTSRHIPLTSQLSLLTITLGFTYRLVVYSASKKPLHYFSQASPLVGVTSPHLGWHLLAYLPGREAHFLSKWFLPPRGNTIREELLGIH